MALWDDLVAYYNGASKYDSWGRYEVNLNHVTAAAGTGLGPGLSSWDYTAGTIEKAAVVQDVNIPCDSGNLTISMWFKGLASGNGSGVTAADNRSPLRIASDELGTKPGGGFVSCGYDVSDIRGLSTWTHIAVTCTGAGDYEYYINGDNVGSISSAAAFDDHIARIGNLNGSDDEFADYITEVAVWSRVLTSDEIEVIYLNSQPRLDGSVAELSLLIKPRQMMPGDKGEAAWINMSGNVLLYHLSDASVSAVDSSGEGHTGTSNSITTGSGLMMHSSSFATSSAGSIYESASSFDGAASYIDTGVDAVTLGVGGNNSRTILFWAEASTWDLNGASGDAGEVIFTMGADAEYEDFTLLSWYPNKLKINTFSDDDYEVILPTSPTNGWNHYALTYNSSSRGMKTFYNGDLLDTHTFAQDLDTSPTNDTKIGEKNYTLPAGRWNNWTGSMLEFAVFTDTLSSVDIKSIYDEQKPPPVPLPCMQSESSPVAPYFGSGFVINNYLNLSDQRLRRTDEIPFVLGVKGPLSLRRNSRISTPAIYPAGSFCTGSS